MIPIQYPKNRRAFELAYIDKLRPYLDVKRLKNALAKIILPDGKTLTWEHLLAAPFNDLAHLHLEIKKHEKGNKQRLAPLIDYTNLHGVIAQFFMEQQSLNLDTCFYCNIDSIYSFNLLGDYKDGLTFVNRAGHNELTNFYGIGDKRAEQIMEGRKKKLYTTIDDCPLPESIKDDLKSFEQAHTHSHFTLDHYLHKAVHPYLSLCLYNFVPCCYVCNSKYKNKHRLDSGRAGKANPGSKMYTFHKDIAFRIFYYRADNKADTIDDYAVNIVVSSNNDSHEVYLSRLHIRARYLKHKRTALELIKKKEQYPDSLIQQLAAQTGQPEAEIRKQIFGRELFDSAYDNSPLVKYKRDIARNVRILH